MSWLPAIGGTNLPKTEQAARTRLTALWFVLLAANVTTVLGTYVLGGFGPLRDPATQTGLLKAFDAVFFVFAPNVTAIFTYWYALRSQRATPLRNSAAFRISWYSSLLWGLIITTVHVAGGAGTYESVLQTLSMHSTWLVSGALAFYFATSKAAGKQSTSGAGNSTNTEGTGSAGAVRGDL